MTPPPPKEVQITLRIPSELARMLDDQAEATRTNRSWVIRDAIHKYFENQRRDDARNEEAAQND
ncbi:MAG: CopG family transcriptional regulator [Planctomycetes bacterium]|nr:CopG family transcriptional regulator [Planctomycetota bacterium]